MTIYIKYKFLEKDFRMVEDNKLRLGYWKIRGLAAPARYILAYVGADSKNDMYEQGDGPEFSREVWTSVKPTLPLDYPNLPYLIDGDVKVTESQAIYRYICNKYDSSLLGKNNKDRAHVDMMSCIIMEAKGKGTMLCYGGQEV